MIPARTSVQATKPILTINARTPMKAAVISSNHRVQETTHDYAIRRSAVTGRDNPG